MKLQIWLHYKKLFTNIVKMLTEKIRDSQVGGIFAIIGGFILHLTLGTLYCFGNMNTYMTSYLRTHVAGQVSREFNLELWLVRFTAK